VVIPERSEAAEVSIEDTIRAAVREEVERALQPLAAEIARLRAVPAIAAAPAVSEDDYLALDICEQICGYAVSTLRKAIAAGELPAKKGKKEWRVRRGDLKAWIQKRSGDGLDIETKAERILAGTRRR
jgi:hypothetical protein